MPCPWVRLVHRVAPSNPHHFPGIRCLETPPAVSIEAATEHRRTGSSAATAAACPEPVLLSDPTPAPRGACILRKEGSRFLHWPKCQGPRKRRVSRGPSPKQPWGWLRRLSAPTSRGQHALPSSHPRWTAGWGQIRKKPEHTPAPASQQRLTPKRRRHTQHQPCG